MVVVYFIFSISSNLFKVKMIKLTDFTNICRLCLRQHDQQFVDLFSKPKIVQQVTENELLVAEMVETFCSVKVRRDKNSVIFR